MAFTALDALREAMRSIPSGRDRRHLARGAPCGLERVVQAGAQPISWVSLACELQRDWARVETVPRSSRSCSPTAC